jgi:hypothetical protein
MHALNHVKFGLTLNVVKHACKFIVFVEFLVINPNNTILNLLLIVIYFVIKKQLLSSPWKLLGLIPHVNFILCSKLHHLQWLVRMNLYGHTIESC